VFIARFYCRGGDDTQGAFHAKSPLEPHGAANKRDPERNKKAIDVTVQTARPCAGCTLTGIHASNT